MYNLHLQSRLEQTHLWTGWTEGHVYDLLLRASEVVAMISLNCLQPKPKVELVYTTQGMNSSENGGEKEVQKEEDVEGIQGKQRKMVGFPGWLEQTQVCLKPFKIHSFSCIHSVS